MKYVNVLVTVICVALAGCTATGEQHRSDTYQAAEVNQKIEAKTIEIIAILPARVAVDNTAGKEAAQTTGVIAGALLGGVLGNQSNSSSGTAVGAGAGGLAGAAIGSTVEDVVMVDGIQLTYRQEVIEDIEDVEDGKRVTRTVKHKKTFTSTQVGKQCEYKNGVALLVTTVKDETRIQPNSACPVEAKK